MFAGNFAPAGWAFCDGSLVPISENETLFNLIGTTYGGDGQETFAYPNLQGKIPIHTGQGPGITQNYVLAETGGVEQVNLTAQQIPNHTHSLVGSTDVANSADPTSNILARSPQMKAFINATPSALMDSGMVGSAGGSQPHDNLQPFLCVNFIISLFGVFPSQS
jgi:microcystin-dependent protein